VDGLFVLQKMKTLTSASTFFQKRVFPLIFGFVACLMVTVILSPMIGISIFIAVPIGVIIGVLATIMARHLHSEYMDEVIDAGDRILIRNAGLEESINLRDIREVDSTLMRPAGIWIHLRRDSVFGRSMKFLPGASLLGFSKLAKALNKRIKEAEQ
jgi:hypothetical protein